MAGKYVRQFKKGSLEMLLLCLVAQKETYGYELITRLNQGGADVLGYAREGTVYPILYRLQDAGLITSRIVPAANGGSKKYYSITPRGRETLDELIDFWQAYTRCVNGFINDGIRTEEQE